MSFAPNYVPSNSFADDETNQASGRSTVRTAPLDLEFDTLAAALNALNANVQLNQRDDGEIRDQRVKLHTLAPDVLKLVTAGGGTLRGPWVTATAYALKDVVTQSGNTYVCAIAHTAGTFATDLAANRWILLQLGAATGASGIAFTPTGTLAATNVQAAIEEADAENRSLSTAETAARIAADTLIRNNLADAASATQGPSLVAFSPALNYAVSTIGAGLQDSLVNAMWFLTDAERTQVKTNGATIDLTSKINAAKTWGGNRPVYLPAGTWSFTSLDFKGNTGGIVGDGIGVTVLKCRSAVTRALDFNDTSDTNPRSYILKDFTLDGSNLATIGIDIRYRHAGIKESLFIVNCPTAGIKELDTYLSRNRNVRVAANGIGWWLVGSNHASTHDGCTYDSNTVGQLLVQSNGTPADGNFGLTWTGCDFEFGGASAYGIDINCDDATFLGGYLGENISQNGLVVRRGSVKVIGGTLYFGHTTTSYGVTPLAGKVHFIGTVINGQTNPGIERLVGGLPSLAGKVKFEDITFNGLVTGTPSWVGDVLDYGPQGQVYAERLGKNWTVQTNNVTASSVVAGNQQTFTVLTAPGPSPLLGANCPLTNSSKWLDGAPLYLVLVYESSKPITVRTSNGAFGAAVLSIASLPATTGTRLTALCFQTNATAAAATLLEIFQSSSAVGDTLIVYEAFLADARMLNRGVGAVGNLYKC